MEITQSTLDILFRTASTKFSTVLETAVEFALSSGIAEIMPMNTLVQDFAWPARIPAMRQWVGPRTTNGIALHAKRFAAKPWELTFELLEEHLKFDQFGVFNQSIAYLAQQCKKHVDYTVADYLLAGGTTGYDGVNYFSDVHPTAGGDVVRGLPVGTPSTQSNDYDGYALSSTNYAFVRAAMRSLLGEDGKPLNIEPNVLAVPPQLEQVGKTILESDIIANAAVNIPVSGGGQNIVLNQSNVFKNTAKLVVVPELATDPTTWYLFDTSKPVKPIIFAQLEAPYFTYLINPDSPQVFNERKYLYGARSWDDTDGSLWFLAARASA
jgi:phage major head subunit gpT-like protein